MKIILIGYMGSGKSTVGNQLSKILNYNFKDLDTEIEQKEEKTISNIFSEKGEIYFRKKEGDILKEVVNTNHGTQGPPKTQQFNMCLHSVCLKPKHIERPVVNYRLNK